MISPMLLGIFRKTDSNNRNRFDDDLLFENKMGFSSHHQVSHPTGRMVSIVSIKWLSDVQEKKEPVITKKRIQINRPLLGSGILETTSQPQVKGKEPSAPIGASLISLHFLNRPLA